MGNPQAYGYIFATLPRTQRGTPLVLGGDPKGKNFLYTNGNSVIIRDIENPLLADIYTEHATQTTVAKYSPSGFYIASCDISGKVRIWDTTQKEHILKNEFIPFGGRIKDLAWSPDNQRIVVVGEGRERFGHVFSADTGTSVGEIAGHSNLINSVDFRPGRPFRIITGSEDNSVGLYEGPPFKFKNTLNDHTKFVQSVRFSPNGEMFASGGFDGKMFVYKTSDYSKVGELGSPGHTGGVYGVAWSPDGQKILSASGDRTCKLWDVATLAPVTEFAMGPDVEDQQVSCLWQGPHLLTVSLSGFINYLDPDNPSQPRKILKGHNKSITAIGLTPDRSTLFTGSHDGHVNILTSLPSLYLPIKYIGVHDRVKGKPHKNQVQDMTVFGESISTCGLDDTVRSISLSTYQYSNQDVKMDSQPRSVAATAHHLVVAEISGLTVLDERGSKISSLPVDYEPTCISATAEGDVVVGAAKDCCIHAYTLRNDGQLTARGKTGPHTGAITDISHSPSGEYFAASDANRKMVPYCTDTLQPTHELDWCFHTARINSVAWSPDSSHLATGSLDTNIIVWSLDTPAKHLTIKKAHPQNQVTRVMWLDNQSLASAEQGGTIKVWDLTL
ncbi:WDR1 [Cordylochernes scorpioides]|uniref:WDR1 n=1 Tax=Cordylochernes scorpioides TaxID=51811 RepID=A0ABY6LEM2_9ARAC|nr:WDR1 [Cordylochernes scorpioides]